MRPLLVVWTVLVAAGCSGAGTDKGGEGPDAPGDGGTMQGAVFDEGLRPIPGAKVLAIGDLAESNATTDANGDFSMAGLPAGIYVVTASKANYSSFQQLVTVSLGDPDPAPIRFQLVFLRENLAYFQPYELEGYIECSAFPTKACDNVNIVTWIVLCQYDLCLGNVTGDRTLLFQWIDFGPEFLQTELVWKPTSDTGRELLFAIGSGTPEQLRAGQATTYNYTQGPSPLMLTMSDSILNESGIGNTSALLVQVAAGVAYPIPGGCIVYDPCGPGATVAQSFHIYTHAFWGYRPPDDWRFADDSSVPPPP